MTMVTKEEAETRDWQVPIEGDQWARLVAIFGTWRAAMSYADREAHMWNRRYLVRGGRHHPRDRQRWLIYPAAVEGLGIPPKEVE